MNQDFEVNNILDKSLNDGSFYQNPYPVYKYLRSHSPIVWSSNKEGFYITTYRHIETILRNYSLYKKNTSSMEHIENIVIKNKTIDFIAQWPFYRNDNYQLEKKKTQQLFNSNIEKINDLFNEYNIVRKKCNLMESLFVPVALLSILRIMEIGENEYKNIKHYSKFILRLMQNDLSPKNETKLDQSISYFQELYNQYKHKNILKFGTFCNLLIDGYEPLAQTLAYSTILCSEYHPQETDIHSFITEVLRMFPPFQYLVRYSNDNIMLEGSSIPKDTKIYLVIASANRDEKTYRNSENFFYKRKEKNILSFGKDTHVCMGSKLTYQVVSVFLKLIINKNIYVDQNSRSVNPYTGTLFIKELQGGIQ